MNASYCVLLVEDDQNDVLFMERAFRKANIPNPICVAHDGREAIDYLSGTGRFANRNQHPLPCLIILDLKMPRMTGMDVLQWLREQPVLYCLPVIVLSSSSHRNDVERAYRLGANAFVLKPGSNEERGKLAQLIKEFWLELNEPPMMVTEGIEAAERFHCIGVPAAT